MDDFQSGRNKFAWATRFRNINLSCQSFFFFQHAQNQKSIPFSILVITYSFKPHFFLKLDSHDLFRMTFSAKIDIPIEGVRFQEWMMNVLTDILFQTWASFKLSGGKTDSLNGGEVIKSLFTSVLVMQSWRTSVLKSYRFWCRCSPSRKKS